MANAFTGSGLTSSLAEQLHLTRAQDIINAVLKLHRAAPHQ